MTADVELSASALVTRTCGAQGLPEQVEDPTALARVAQLLRPMNGNGTPKGAGATITTTPLAQRGGRRGSG